MHLVDEAGTQVLLDRGCASAKPDVCAVRCFERPLERRFDSVGDEVERGPALHRDRSTRVMGEHENRVVIWRGVAPPPPPPVVLSPAPDWGGKIVGPDTWAAYTATPRGA